MNNIIEKYRNLPIQLRASFFFLICSFLQKGISMITTPIFTRIMSTADYGKYGVFTSWLSIITIIVSMNLFAGVHIQGLVKFSQDRSIYSSSLLGLTTFLIFFWTIVYFSFKPFLNHMFSLPTEHMVAMILIIWSTSVFNFWANEQRVTYSYKLLVLITVMVSILKPIVEIALVIQAKDKVSARIAGETLSDIFLYSWMAFYLLYKGRHFYSYRYWKYSLIFCIPLLPHYLSQTVLNCADRIMIQNIVGKREAGIYSLAYSISLIMTLFNVAISHAISPWIYQKIKEKKGCEIAPIAYSTFVLIASLNLLLIIMAPEVVKVFAPKSYYGAIDVIPPIAMSVFFMYIYDFFAKFAFYYEKTMAIMFASVMGALLNLLLNYTFIRRFGYIAAGYTTLLCYMVYAAVHYIFMRKVCRECCDGKYPYDTKRIIIITVTFLALGFIIMLTYKAPLLRYGMFIIVIGFLVLNKKKIMLLIKNLVRLKE